MKKFTFEELKGYKGENGAPVYVAYDGKVFDVSSSYLWEDGSHQGEHDAGKDLTNEIADAPHEPDRLDNFPIVGEIG
ncbi:MAG: cytochrome B5 [Thermoleophilia bacterium]|nr:cytochrome B5 [Thermoleophilia bacterium]